MLLFLDLLPPLILEGRRSPSQQLLLQCALASPRTRSSMILVHEWSIDSGQLFRSDCYWPMSDRTSK